MDTAVRGVPGSSQSFIVVPSTLIDISQDGKWSPGGGFRILRGG